MFLSSHNLLSYVSIVPTNKKEQPKHKKKTNQKKEKKDK